MFRKQNKFQVEIRLNPFLTQFSPFWALSFLEKLGRWFFCWLANIHTLITCTRAGVWNTQAVKKQGRKWKVIVKPCIKFLTWRVSRLKQAPYRTCQSVLITAHSIFTFVIFWLRIMWRFVNQNEVRCVKNYPENAGWGKLFFSSWSRVDFSVWKMCVAPGNWFFKQEKVGWCEDNTASARR